MRDLIRRLPQLHRLAVFDAVVSAGSFTAAARELEISQPAVSRHMASLRRELGFDVFERTGRSLTLTPKGRTLADAVADSFRDLERTLSDIEVQSQVFVLAAQPAMATSWVVPMLDQLESAAETEIRLRIFERPGELEVSEWDLAIVPGVGRWAHWESSMLFREVVRPFAAPALAEARGLDEHSSPSDLVDENLMHIDPAGRPNMTWAEWFVEAGGPAELPTPRVRYNAYPTVIQEAIAGNGIALGWQHLLNDLVDRGLLVPVGPIVRRQHGGHYVCWRSGDDDDRHRAIRQRLSEEIHRDLPKLVR